MAIIRTSSTATRSRHIRSKVPASNAPTCSRTKACRRESGLASPAPVREAVHLYAERHTANDLDRIMGRSQKKDTTLDHLPAATVTKASVALER